MFLCCGDALFDMFVTKNREGETVSNVNLAGHVGGSPMNVATGLARLEHKSRYFTKLSSDLFGQRMRGHFKANGIDTELCVDTGLNTTLAIVETQADGSAAYVFYTDNTADVSIQSSELPETLPADVQVVHFGSYSTAVEPGSSSLMQLASRESASRVISYDPNLRPSIEPDIEKWREVFAGYASSANIIKASDEDIETLFGKNAEEKFVADSFAHGAQLVFITRGPDGASGFSADGQTAHQKGVKVSVVDTVGAGDTFQATTLHWMQREGHLKGAAELDGTVDLAACIELAINAAAATCTRSGADLPYLSELPS